MKEKIFAFLCLMSLLLSGCYEDKGNYDYNNLLKITITGFLSEKEDGTESEITSLTVTAGQVVKVRPILSFENEKDKKNSIIRPKKFFQDMFFWTWRIWIQVIIFGLLSL